MNTKKFSEAMGEIDSQYIEKAISYHPGRQKLLRMKWGAIAACLALLAYAGARLLSPETPDIPKPPTLETPENMPKLPMLSLADNTDDGMGFSGVMAYDVSELVNANPWSESLELSTLPVYRNTLTYGDNFVTTGADFCKMREFLLEIAGRFGIDANAADIMINAPDEETEQKVYEQLQAEGSAVLEEHFPAETQLAIEADGIKIEVSQNMTATIRFEPAISLPDEYHYASYEDTAAAAEYLRTEYQNVLAMEDPQINICGGDYTINADQDYSINFYEGSGDVTQRIINYNFNRVVFYHSDGELYMIRISHPDLSGKVEDYPMITPEQAAELLSNGIYCTSVPYDMPGPKYVKKMELVYLTGELEKYYMPYYCFYVELPEEERENGLKTFGLYYVPAVHWIYISNMPIYAGHFD